MLRETYAVRFTAEQPTTHLLSDFPGAMESTVSDKFITGIIVTFDFLETTCPQKGCRLCPQFP